MLESHPSRWDPCEPLMIDEQYIFHRPSVFLSQLGPSIPSHLRDCFLCFCNRPVRLCGNHDTFLRSYPFRAVWKSYSRETHTFGHPHNLEQDLVVRDILYEHLIDDPCGQVYNSDRRWKRSGCASPQATLGIPRSHDPKRRAP